MSGREKVSPFADDQDFVDKVVNNNGNDGICKELAGDCSKKTKCRCHYFFSGSSYISVLFLVFLE